MKPIELLNLEQRRSSKAFLANELRRIVFTCREQGYINITNTTQLLLCFWK